MHIDWWTLGLQTVNVLVLVWLLKRFLFAPVAVMIEARRQAATAMLDQAKAAKAETDAARADVARRAAEVLAARDRQIAAATEEAKQLKDRLTVEARAEIEKMRQQADAEARLVREEQMAVLTRQADALAIDMTSRLLDRLPTTARTEGFFDGLGQVIVSLSPEERSRLPAGGAVTLRSARPLSEDDRQRYHTRIAEFFATPVELAFEVDESLIAGLELVSPYVSVRNSLRADLERISSELEKRDDKQ